MNSLEWFAYSVLGVALVLFLGANVEAHKIKRMKDRNLLEEIRQGASKLRVKRMLDGSHPPMTQQDRSNRRLGDDQRKWQGRYKPGQIQLTRLPQIIELHQEDD